MASRGKKRSSGKYFIYYSKLDKWIETDEATYKAFYREVWRLRKQAQKLGRCRCPRHKLWACDGDCLECGFHSDGVMNRDDDDQGQVTFHSVNGSMLTPEEECAAMQLLEALRDRLSELDSKGWQIFDLLSQEVLVSNIAETIGRPQRTLASQLERYRPELRKVIKGIR